METNVFEPCLRLRRYSFINQVTGEISHVPCNSYSCDVCGPRKKRKLYKGMSEFLKTFTRIRFWTFTLSSKVSLQSDVHHNDGMRLSWRIFVKELRRCKLLREHQRTTKYVRVAEVHKSGLVHYHVCFGEFLPVDLIRRLWEHATSLVFNVSTQKKCNVNVKAQMNLESCVKYIVKYVTKQNETQIMTQIRKKYSVSQNTRLFRRLVTVSPYKFVRYTLEDGLILNTESETTQKYYKTLFELEFIAEKHLAIDEILEVFRE
jgi:hypothetical protein